MTVFNRATVERLRRDLYYYSFDNNIPVECLRDTVAEILDLCTILSEEVEALKHPERQEE